MLLETNTSLYLKRLAKELKLHWIRGFYSCGERWNQAKFSGGKLFVRFGSRAWEDRTGKIFFDADGKEIVANREV